MLVVEAQNARIEALQQQTKAAELNKCEVGVCTPSLLNQNHNPIP